MIRSRYGEEVHHASDSDQMVRKYEAMAHQAKRQGDFVEAEYLFNHAEHYKKGDK